MKILFNSLLSLFAVVYTLFYMSLNDLTTNDGALSKTGLTHPFLFFIWGALIYCALYLNIFALAKSFYKITNFHIIFAVSSLIGMAFTLFFKFDYSLKFQYFMHCAGSLIFSVCTGTEVFITYLYGFKKNTINAVLTIIIALLLIADLILLIIFKQNALIEAVPVIFALIAMPATLAYNTLKKRNKEFANASR